MEGANFISFRQKVIDFLKLDNDNDFCWEVIFDIVEGTGPFYEFDFEHLRLTSDFLMAAVLLSIFHNKKVMVLEPTSYYSFQAVQMFRRWKINAPNLSIGLVGSADLQQFDVIFHHGRLFDCVYYGKRTILQIFKDVEVPQDCRSLSTLIEIANQ